MMKKPVLPIALLMAYILFHKLAVQGKLDKFLKRDGVIPYSCRSAMVKLRRRIPPVWKAECQKNIMYLEAPFSMPPAPMETKVQRMAMYREMANHLVFVSRNAPDDNMLHVQLVRLDVTSSNLTLQAAVLGKDLVPMAVIPTQQLLAQYLQKVVRVVELDKDKRPIAP